MTEHTSTTETFDKGISAFREGKYSESVCDLSKAIRLNPEMEIAYLTRGVAYMRTDRLNLALDDFDKAIELNPEYRRAYHLRAIAHYKRGDLEKALHDLDKAIEVDPEYGAACLSRANVHRELGHSQEADEDMEMVTVLQRKTSKHLPMKPMSGDLGILDWRLNECRERLKGKVETMLQKY